MTTCDGAQQDKDKMIASLTTFVLFFILLVPASLWSAYVATVIWAWYVPDWPVLTLKMAVAVRFVYAALFSLRHAFDSEDKKEDPWLSLSKFIGLSFIAPLILLGIARFVLFFL